MLLNPESGWGMLVVQAAEESVMGRQPGWTKPGPCWRSVQCLTWSFQHFADAVYSIHNRTAWRLSLSLYMHTQAIRVLFGGTANWQANLQSAFYKLLALFEKDKHATTGSWLGKKHTNALHYVGFVWKCLSRECWLISEVILKRCLSLLHCSFIVK